MVFAWLNVHDEQEMSTLYSFVCVGSALVLVHLITARHMHLLTQRMHSAAFYAGIGTMTFGIVSLYFFVHFCGTFRNVWIRQLGPGIQVRQKRYCKVSTVSHLVLTLVRTLEPGRAMGTCKHRAYAEEMAIAD